MDSRAKILVVDDDTAVRSFVEDVLTNDGHEVVAVDSGEAALECISNLESDLALLDLRLKGIDGMAVLADLCHRWPDPSIIMLTAHGSMETAVDALRQGAHDYLFKPCTTVELRESVRTGLLKRRRELQQRELMAQLRSLTHSLEEIGRPVGVQPGLLAAGAASVQEQGRFLRYGGLILDLTRHVVTLDDTLLELSPTEFNLLAHLVSEAPRVVSPQELVREVLGHGSELWEAQDMVRSHICHIRRKTEAATGRSNLIRTVRGVGYTIGD